MMNYTIIVAAATLFSIVGASAFAALPPFYETLKEFNALLEDPEFQKHFTSADVIEKIEREEGVFTITTNMRTIHVRIEYEPATMPGPSKFHFVYEKE